MSFPAPLPDFTSQLPTPEPEPEVTPDETYAEITAPPAKPKRTRKPRAPRGSETVTARTVHRILETYEKIQGADTLPRTILASALGTDDDPAEIVAAIASQARVTVPGVSELLEIVEAAATGPFPAMAKATQHEAAAKPIWHVLTTLELVSGNLPSKDATAAMAIAEAATNLDANQQQTLEATLALAQG